MPITPQQKSLIQQHYKKMPPDQLMQLAGITKGQLVYHTVGKAYEKRKRTPVRTMFFDCDDYAKRNII